MLLRSNMMSEICKKIRYLRRENDSRGQLCYSFLKNLQIETRKTLFCSKNKYAYKFHRDILKHCKFHVFTIKKEFLKYARKCEFKFEKSLNRYRISQLFVLSLFIQSKSRNKIKKEVWLRCTHMFYSPYLQTESQTDTFYGVLPVFWIADLWLKVDNFLCYFYFLYVEDQNSV